MFNKTFNKTLKQLSIFSMGLGIAFTLTQTVYAENASEIISFHNKTPDSNELLNAFMKNTKHNKDSVERMAENGSSQQPVRFRGSRFRGSEVLRFPPSSQSAGLWWAGRVWRLCGSVVLFFL